MIIQLLPHKWPGFRHISSRAIVLVPTFLCVALVLGADYDQRQMAIPDSFGFEFAIRNFAQGKWVLSDAEMNQSLVQAVQQGESLVMYVPAGPDRWVFGKSPGYPLLAMPFQWLGVPRLANVALGALAILALYRCLAACYNRRTANLAAIVFLFSPISLLAMHYATMDTFAGGALLAISGSILLYAHRRLGKDGLPLPYWLAAGLAAGWAVTSRIHSLPLLGILSLFAILVITRNSYWSRPTKGRQMVVFFLGVALSLSVLLLYNKVVFGQFFDTGYRYPSPFQHLYLWEAEPATEVYGVKTWLADGTLRSMTYAVFQHMAWWLEPLLRGWPLFPLALSTLLLLMRRRQISLYYVLLLAWLAATYLLYSGVFYFGITRELVVPYYRTSGFFAVTRYLYPAIFPITLLTVETLRRMPDRLANAIVICLAIYTVVWFISFTR